MQHRLLIAHCSKILYSSRTVEVCLVFTGRCKDFFNASSCKEMLTPGEGAVAECISDLLSAADAGEQGAGCDATKTGRAKQCCVGRSSLQYGLCRCALSSLCHRDMCMQQQVVQQAGLLYNGLTLSAMQCFVLLQKLCLKSARRRSTSSPSLGARTSMPTYHWVSSGAVANQTSSSAVPFPSAQQSNSLTTA